MVATARLCGIAVVAVSLALTGCTMINPVRGSRVPRMQIEPATVHPGDSIAVTTVDSCGAKVPDGGWAVVAGHVGDGELLVKVRSSDTLDGSFRVELTLPRDFPIGEAYAGIDNWDYSTCADNASYAGPMGSFTVEP